MPVLSWPQQIESVLTQVKVLLSQKRGNELAVLDLLRGFESKNADNSFPPEFHLAAFNASYICCSRAINFFHNPHDALFNGMYAFIHLLPAGGPPADKAFKLYRMMAEAYSRFGRYDTALFWCEKAESALTSDSIGLKYYATIAYTRYSIFLKSGRYDDAESVIKQVKERDEKIGVFFKLRGEHELFIRKDFQTARAAFQHASDCEECSDDPSIKFSFASILAREGKWEESFTLFDQSCEEYETMDDRKKNPWHYLFYGKTLKQANPAEALIKFRKAVDLLNGGAEQGADILGRAAYMEEHPGLYEEIFSELLDINGTSAWETLQYIKNYYLVLELTHEGYTHKIWNLLKYDGIDEITPDFRHEIIDYCYKNFEQVSPDLKMLQLDLVGEEVILDYHCRENDSVCFIIRKDGVEVKIIEAGINEIKRLGAQGSAILMHALNTLTLNPSVSSDQEERRLFAKQTGALLLPSGLSHFHVTVVPDGTLFHLPFQILFLPGTDDPLCKASIFSLASNATLLAKRIPRKKAKKIAFLHDAGMMFAGRELADLQKKWDVHIVEDVAGLKSIAEGSGIIHFAGHFTFDEKISLSWFDLGCGKKMRLKDLMDIALFAADVVLNVCESGRQTEYGTGTEYFDAARFFLRAGARQVITTTMSVSEGTAYLFSMELYDRLVNLAPAEALHDLLVAKPAFAEICPYVVRL